MLNFRVTGDGSPVVLLHGYMESREMWDGLFDQMINFSWWAVDLPGHGDSPLENEQMEPSIVWFATKVIEFMDANNIGSCHLVGHSMGGYIALQLKNLIPERIKKVILLNSHPWEDAPSKKTDRLRVAEIAFKAKSLFIKEAIPALFYNKAAFEEDIQELIIHAEKMSSDAIAYAALAMRSRTDCSNVVSRNSKDFLFIQGKYDPLIPQDRISEFALRNELTFFLLERSGHMAHLEEPTHVKKIVREFLDVS